VESRKDWSEKYLKETESLKEHLTFFFPSMGQLGTPPWPTGLNKVRMGTLSRDGYTLPSGTLVGGGKAPRPSRVTVPTGGTTPAHEFYGPL
jgi:hypothetical protein